MRARILNLTFGTHALKVKGQKATFLSHVVPAGGFNLEIFLNLQGSEFIQTLLLIYNSDSGCVGGPSKKNLRVISMGRNGTWMRRVENEENQANYISEESSFIKECHCDSFIGVLLHCESFMLR